MTQPPPVPPEDVPVPGQPPRLRAREPRERSGSSTKTVLLILGAGLVAMLGLGAVFVFVTFDLPVEERDRAVLLTTSDLEGWIEGLEDDPGVETVSKERMLDGSVELSYEFDGDGVFLLCTVNVERNPMDARAVYLGAKTGTSLFVDSIDGRLEATDRFDFGDVCDVYDIRGMGGVAVGTALLCRSGRRVFDLVLVGHCIEDAEDFRRLLGPVLARFAAYEP